jgi:hypothetical protein
LKDGIHFLRFDPFSEKAKVLQLSQDFFYFWDSIQNLMNKGHLFHSVLLPVLVFSPFESGLEKETLVMIIDALIVILLLILGFEIQRFARNRKSAYFTRLFRKAKLEVRLEKDRPFRPKVLTLTIINNGKHEVDIDAPVLEFRKIWSKRKFKLNGINGQAIYPMFIDTGKAHQLRIEISTFYQYDREIKSYYWARVCVTDAKGRKCKSNNVKLRKSLVT